MKRLLVILLVFSFLLNIVLVYRELQSMVAVSVPDGDSLDLAGGRRVRLLGLDAPEKGRCMADVSKARLSELVLGKRVRLKNVVKDSYGRQLADVIDEDLVDTTRHAWEFIKRALGFPHTTPLSKNAINRAMVEEGLASYHGSSTEYGVYLRAASDEAREKKLGIYSPECLQTAPMNESCVIKGNVRNGEKTYHLPGCDNYDQTTISLSFGDQWFCSEDEAVEAGFEKATGCRE